MSNHQHNFIISTADTDAILFHKQDQTEFSQTEKEELIDEINSLLPEFIKMEFEAEFKRVVVVKSKNYILDNGKKIKLKGSSMIAAQKEPIILELINKIAHLLLDNKLSELLGLYQEYVIKSQSVQDVCLWATKKTITKSVLEPSRLNEQKVLDALRGKEVHEGDKVFVFYDKDDNLQLVENWIPGNESKQRLIKRIYDTFKIFQKLIPFNEFPKYHLKTRIKELELLCQK
jgi:DNA polymerase elongation subunit (family B)